ncbi:sigma-70 family RNA polymerase sigma factor [Baekduia soli]|uniref:Sigma-70 family RNA polymerase sigma factor n=1 Tax=Baekduia soli TaxID=496014 RepID=A0A5B8U327_9ACTN|nr:sigma-70 family RNA polymerase sigma factor [Baekduia soli]QEC47436.1 sigma-70 family RNA polymerase sigma factor [Baekduia soli]
MSSSSIASPALAPVVLRRRGDGALRSRAARGSEAAFAVVYERHHQALYRYCRSIVDHDEDACDALQSTMARAFAALQHEDRDFELRPWLFRIAHNESISLLRRRRSTCELGEAGEIGGDAMERVVELRQQLAELRGDLDELPERQREALVLRELSGLSHEEIAVVLESSPRAVKQTIFEARVALLEHREGREMECEPCRRALSDGDKRVLRGRRLRSHLRSCVMCQAFQSDLQRRPGELALLAPPLPLATGAAMAAHLLGAGAKSSGALGASSASTGMVATVTGKVALAAAVAVTATGGAIAAPPVSQIFGSAPAAGAKAPVAAPSGTRPHASGSESGPAGITSAHVRDSLGRGQRMGPPGGVPQSATRSAPGPADAGGNTMSSRPATRSSTPVATIPGMHAGSGHDGAEAGRTARAVVPGSQRSPATTTSPSGRRAGSAGNRHAPAQSTAPTDGAKAQHAPPGAPAGDDHGTGSGLQATAGSDHTPALTPSGSARAPQGFQPGAAVPASPAVTTPTAAPPGPRRPKGLTRRPPRAPRRHKDP